MSLALQEAVFLEQFESFLAKFCDAELLALHEVFENLDAKRSERKSGAEGFKSQQPRTAKLIAQMTSKSLTARAQ